MAQQGESDHYIWNLSDILGQGATGAVYKARHKHSGELYAVKTFNQMSYNRSVIVQEREFEVLKCLNHENVVRLIDIEKESSNGTDVIVMELCTGGSLFNLLDDPENVYGIEEKEFKQVLSDVANGMKHLRDREIVHRDIKPGNIMRYISEDGRSIYKLTDFGAARELSDEETFQSMYGTEEYLCPEMYERGVLKLPTERQFSATVDLWSLGVTFYHVATGHLPFRPYGGRASREMMYQITSKKASGVISGVQRSYRGQIEWSRNLPSNCRLSQGMKNLITPVLARLLESNRERMMKFDDFFEVVEDIMSRSVIYVFDLSKGLLLHIYSDQNKQLAQFQELVAEQSGIRTLDQRLLFENHELEEIIDAFQPVSSYPPTSIHNTIYLFSSARYLTPMPVCCTVPVLPPFSSDVSLCDDPLIAKQCCSAVHSMHRSVADVLLKQQLISKAAKMYHLVLSREIERNKDLVTEFFQRVEEIGKRIHLLDDACCMMTSILSDRIKARPDEDEKKRLLMNLKNTFHLSSVTNQKESFKKLLSEVRKMKDESESLHSKVALNVLSWIENSGCQDSQQCILKVDILLRAVKQTASDFVHNRNLKRLSPNEEQIHKFEKLKLKINSSKALTLVQNECYPNTVRMFDEFRSWYSQICEFQHQLQSLKSEMTKMSELHKLISQSLRQTQESRHEKLKSLLNELTVESVGTVPNEKRPTVATGGCDSVFSNRHSTKNKELQELINTLKSRVDSSASLTFDVKNIAEESEKLIPSVDQRQLDSIFLQDLGSVYSTEEPLTLTAGEEVA